jgi:hypothetical protein
MITPTHVHPHTPTRADAKAHMQTRTHTYTCPRTNAYERMHIHTVHQRTDGRTHARTHTIDIVFSIVPVPGLRCNYDAVDYNLNHIRVITSPAICTNT